MKSLLSIITGILSILIVLFAVHQNRLPHDILVIDFLDVGQGDAILITTPDQNTILVDGGPEQMVLEELGEVMPFLRKRIDLLVLTHPHADHMMGLVQVLKRYEVGAVLFSGLNYWSPIYDEFLAEIRHQKIPLYVAQADQDWQFGDVMLDVIYPFEALTGKSMSNVNNGSVVMMIHYGAHRILLTGDAELEVEAEMVAAEIDLQADVLKAGHHGSRTSSSQEFLDRVEPQIAIISCGELNEYQHPHPETLEKFSEMNLTVRRTDEEGRIRIYFP